MHGTYYERQRCFRCKQLSNHWNEVQNMKKKKHFDIHKLIHREFEFLPFLKRSKYQLQYSPDFNPCDFFPVPVFSHLRTKFVKGAENNTKKACEKSFRGLEKPQVY